MKPLPARKVPTCGGVTSHMIAEPLGIDHLTVSNDVATHVQRDRRILPGQLNVGEAPMSID